ncbi:hypothetical protein CCUS01_12639, partial [Colletotrichum cuscutae]
PACLPVAPPLQDCSASLLGLFFSDSSIRHSNDSHHWHSLSQTQSAELHKPQRPKPRLCQPLENPDLMRGICLHREKSHQPGPGSLPADATHRPERPCSPPLGLNRLIRCQKTCCGHNKFTRRCYSPFSRLCNPMGFL